jgi:hypothetical protein
MVNLLLLGTMPHTSAREGTGLRGLWTEAAEDLYNSTASTFLQSGKTAEGSA